MSGGWTWRAGSSYAARMTRKGEIGQRFGWAAPSYDDHAEVQRIAAVRLAMRIGALALPPRPRVLEIGCGTGLLTAELQTRLPHARLVVSDLSADMIAAVRASGRAGRDASFLVMDGERPCLADGAFDLVCSSLAVQWFDDLRAGLAGLARLVRPGGWLAFSTLLAGSLDEWRCAHAGLGLLAAGPTYPQPDELAASRFGGRLVLTEETVTTRHSGGIEFLRALKGLGATTPQPGRRPLSAPQLRRVMAAFDEGGSASTYRLGYGLLSPGLAEEPRPAATVTPTGP